MIASRFGGLAALAIALTVPAARAADTAALLKTIKAVGREGAGNVEAAKAWKELTASGPETLPAILTGMDDANTIASNWLRSAVDAVVEKATAGGKPLPTAELEKFVKDTRHAPVPRGIAYEVLTRADKKAPDRLLPTMLLDPSHELRRAAVSHTTATAQKKLDQGDKPAAIAEYRKALTGAVDQDQVDALVKALKPLGVEVDIAAHLGLIRHWHLATPFDNTNAAGFTVAYAPEKGVDLQATYKGKAGAEVRWQAHTTTDPYGKVDLNTALGKFKGTVAYACAIVESPEERPVEVRAATPNAIKIFLNGKELFFRNEYHHGSHLDQHVGIGTLKKGKNEVLIKVCQNEQTEQWAQTWMFQVRLTDAVGQAVPFAQAKKE